jgi:hypothetical protein
MDVLTFETCCAVNSEIIKRVTSSWSIFIEKIQVWLKFDMNSRYFTLNAHIYFCTISRSVRRRFRNASDRTLILCSVTFF